MKHCKYTRRIDLRYILKFMPLVAVITFIIVMVICYMKSNATQKEDSNQIDEVYETKSTEVMTESVYAPRTNAGISYELSRYMMIESGDSASKEDAQLSEVGANLNTLIEEETDEIHYYDVTLSHDMQDWINTCLDYIDCDLDDSYIIAMIYQESRFDPKALGTSGDSGYCQILQRYFGEIYDDMEVKYPELANEVDKDIWNERANIAAGVFYLNECAIEMSGEKLSRDNLSMALTAYNHGPGGARSYYANTGSYSSSHSRAIINYAEELQMTNTLAGDKL